MNCFLKAWISMSFLLLLLLIIGISVIFFCGNNNGNNSDADEGELDLSCEKRKELLDSIIVYLNFCKKTVGSEACKNETQVCLLLTACLFLQQILSLWNFVWHLITLLFNSGAPRNDIRYRTRITSELEGLAWK